MAGADRALRRAPAGRPARARGRLGRPLAALAVVLAAAAIAAGFAVINGNSPGGAVHVWPPVRDPQLTWAPPGTQPLADPAAAALVTPRPETRPANAAANSYVPTDPQLQAFYDARDSEGHTRGQFSPLLRRVTGRPGLVRPTTDDLVQWAAHKWGIPEDVLSAQVQLESGSRMAWPGDRATVTPAEYAQYPPQSRIPGGHDVYRSLGLAQIKWVPDGSVNAGTEPLRWQSTAFDLDLLAATVRFYYDGYCHWCGAGYTPGQDWASIGAWYSPTPWNNRGAKRYIGSVKHVLRLRSWE